MTESNVTLVVTGTPNPDGMAEMQQYIGAAGPILASHGGETVYRGRITKALSGKASFAMILVMSFPSEANLEAALNSEAYEQIVPLREAGFTHMDFVVSQSMS